MKQIPFNLSEDGTCRTIKAQYYKNGFANFIRGGGYGATGVAVIPDMEESTERMGV